MFEQLKEAIWEEENRQAEINIYNQKFKELVKNKLSEEDYNEIDVFCKGTVKRWRDE